MIRLVGPGGAGKTTVGRALATRLGVAFADLDEQFRQEFGDISAFLNAEGYGAYCTRNIQRYVEIVREAPHDGVLALSSGFLTYSAGAHPEYQAVFRAIIGALRRSFCCPRLTGRPASRRRSGGSSRVLLLDPQSGKRK